MLYWTKNWWKTLFLILLQKRPKKFLISLAQNENFLEEKHSQLPFGNNFAYMEKLKMPILKLETSVLTPANFSS